MIKLLLFALISFSSVCMADEYVNGYTRSNGTYVSGYYRTSADSTGYNNYSASGNYNPYTGQYGHRHYDY